MNNLQYKTIGFFGDSFCATTRNVHSLTHGYTTYIQQLVKHYGVKIVNLGHGGSSVWDIVLNQLPPLISSNSVPDICVFVWTDPGRLYHRTVRNINSVSSQESHLLNKNTWKAANEYYKHVFNYDYHLLAYKSLLLYVDNVILPTLPSTTKIIHLWSFGEPSTWDSVGFIPSNITYPYTWKHGVEIRPSLASIGLNDRSLEELFTDDSANHLDGNVKNKVVFEWIRDAIDV